MKVATLEDIEKYPELNLVEGQEFEPPTTESLNTANEEDPPPPPSDGDDSGGSHPTQPPGKP